MSKTTIQRCPVCESVYRHGIWTKLSDEQVKKVNSAIYAGLIQILDASCKNCEEEGLDGIGHA